MAAGVVSRLLVLGVTDLFSPVNGYQVLRELRSWRVEEWTELRTGAVYSMLKTLTKQGLLERREPVDEGRAVTVYETTAAAKAELRRLVTEILDGTLGLDSTSLQAGLTFTMYLTRAEVVAALRERITVQQAVLRSMEEKIELIRPVTPPMAGEVTRLGADLVAAELRWLRERLPAIEQGRLNFADDPPWQPPKGVDELGSSLNTQS